MMEDKHIEEMAKVLCEDCARDPLPCDLTKAGIMCDSVIEQADALYNAGYRKASEVVNEVFADVFKAIRKYYIEAEHTKSVTCELMLDDLKGDLAELKKKYTESENDDG
jgi:hypothetical protein